VGPARLFPDVGGGASGVVATHADGSRHIIVAGIRVVDHPDGSLERAREILPSGPARVVTIPNRLGGGLLVYVPAGGSTQLWRAKSWLDRLEPLGEIWGTVGDVVPGFDRVYARLTSGDIKAIDPGSGRQISLGPLPRATRIGQLAFADAWRAVAVVDYRGALATFDAGMTWRAIPVGEAGVHQLSLRSGDFVLDAPRQRLVLGPRGDIEKEDVREASTRAKDASPSAGSNEGAGNAGWSFEAAARRAGSDNTGFGRRPLRAAIEDGFPEAQTPAGAASAIVAHGGSLHRIALDSGKVTYSRSAVFRGDDGNCHAVSMGAGFGFICGAIAGGTAIYAFSAPFELREIARFTRPRMVTTSGNGGFVARGSCARDAGAASATSDAFCFFAPNGDEREVKAPVSSKREAALLLPVALGDGRAAFVVAPDSATAGKLLLEQGKGFAAVALAAPLDRSLLSRSTFLDGFEERTPGVLGGWIATGAELRGIRIALDGKVEVGRVTTNVERTAVSGRFALEWGRGGRGVETIDGGMTYRPIDLPASDLPAPGRAVAACGAVGCTQGGWLRVGWGAAEVPDLLPAAPPKPSRVNLASPRGIALRCQPTGEMSGPVKPSVRPSPAAPNASPPKSGATTRKPSSASGSPSPLATSGKAPLPPIIPTTPRLPPIFQPMPSRSPATPLATASSSPWSPFRGESPPQLRPTDVGLEAGTDPPMTMQARIYAWGPRGAEWSLKGHVQARFDDRFERAGTRVTSIAPAPWASEDRAGDALGLTTGQSINWSSLLDGTGQSALLIGQRGAAKADLYAASVGQPLVPLRDVDHAPLPPPNSFVRSGSSWFFLVSTMTTTTWAATLYRADGGIVRKVARLPRIPVPAGEFAPKLMRRAASDALGILVQGAPGFDQVIRDWYVLPIDPDSGELGEPVRLFGSDLEGRIPERCAPDRDGWIVNTDLSLAPAVQVVAQGQINVSAIELRVRLDPGTVCIDAMAARAEGLTFAPPAPPNGADAVAGDLPLAATDTSSGRRLMLKCGK
jgi:hypothetical protein